MMKVEVYSDADSVVRQAECHLRRLGKVAAEEKRSLSAVKGKATAIPA